MAADIDAFTAAQIALTPPLDLRELAVVGCLELGFIDAGQSDHILVRTTIGAPPSTTAPMAILGSKGTPILRTRIKSSGVLSAEATSAATGTPRAAARGSPAAGSCIAREPQPICDRRRSDP